mgnify:CR=1 FL=1
MLISLRSASMEDVSYWRGWFHSRLWIVTSRRYASRPSTTRTCSIMIFLSRYSAWQSVLYFSSFASSSFE